MFWPFIGNIDPLIHVDPIKYRDVAALHSDDQFGINIPRRKCRQKKDDQTDHQK